jgi:hypothetical protein
MTTKMGSLSQYFKSVVVKKLSAVEADKSRSNQHEYNGVAELKAMFGADAPRKFAARFIWLSDEQEALSEDGFVTWYDARASHPTRSEYRLYFPTTPVSEMAVEGDVMFIARRVNDVVFIIIVPAGSTIQNQLLWLFGLSLQPTFQFAGKKIEGESDAAMDFATTYILDELGIEPAEPGADLLDGLLEQFGLTFPTTREFSDLARASLPNVSAVDDPDVALLAWMDREEQLFRRLERHIVAERLSGGFATNGIPDVDGFLGFSLSVQNRRKSRAGFALENHLEALFTAHHIRFDRGAETENRNKPDFLFPGASEYRNPLFSDSRLTMLGSKSTLKDRWRQVLSEAIRIKEKHLLTLEPSVSENQTDEMRAKNLRLVVPSALHATYRPRQREWLMSVAGFVHLVKDRQ